MCLFRADGYHNKSLSEDTPNFVTMSLADLYHLSYSHFALSLGSLSYIYER
jgi:hypothetical protein